MKLSLRFLIYGAVASLPLFLLAGCYTTMGTAREDTDEGYDSQSAVTAETPADSTQSEDYDTARREFYNDSYYSYPWYSVGIGYGWRTPWFGYGYPWYYYDMYPFYGGYYPFAFWYPHYHPGIYYNGGGFGYGHYGRGYATRRFGMARTGGGSRGAYATPTGVNSGPTNPSGRTGAVRGTVSTGRSHGRVVTGTAPSRERPAARVSTRSHTGARAPASRPAGSSGTSTGRSGGRTYSAPGSHPAPSGGATRGGGGGGGSRSGGGGGGGSRGGGGRR